MLFVLSSLAACQPSSTSSGSDATTVDSSTPSVTVDETPVATDPVPVEATTFETKIITQGLSVEQEMEVQKAAEIIKLVVSSEEFKERILNHTVNGVKTFLNNNGLTNEQIYQKILEAAESDNLVKDNIMELTLELIPQTSSTKSWFTRIVSGIRKIFVYLNLFQNTTPAGIAQTLFQQWLSKLGFEQPSDSSTKLTVQSAVSSIIRELGEKYL